MNSSDSTRELLPTRGWLGRYVELTEGLSACPRFRFFAAACVLGAAVNNKIWLKRGTTGTLFPKFFPNPWIVLLAPPGRGYKTSTINMATNVLTKACPEVRVLSDKITPEAVVSALSSPQTPKEVIRIGPRDATGLIKAPELSVFFGRQQYNISLVSLITDLYDYREIWSSETIGRGKNVLKRNCLSILGGSTPQWLQNMLPQDAFTGGFMSRFVLIEMPPAYNVRKTFPEEPTPGDWLELVAKLGEIGRQEGELDWDDKAREAYKEIYEGYSPSGDTQLDAYKEREAEHILKLAMLLSLSEEAGRLNSKHLERSRKIVKALETEISPRIERLTTHPRMALTQEIVDLLKMHGSLSEKTLLKMLYRFLPLGESQFWEAVGILKKTGIIIPEGTRDNWVFRLKGGGGDG